MIIYLKDQGYYLVSFKPTNHLAIKSSYKTIDSAERAQYYLEMEEDRGGFCIAKYLDEYFVCERSDFEKVAGYTNFNEHLIGILFDGEI